MGVSRRKIWFLSLCAAATLCVGCAVNPATGGRDFVLMSEEEEVQLGRQYVREVYQQYNKYKNDKLQTYVEAIGNKLAAKGERPQLGYSFTVLDSEEVNAFALPGGHIFVTRGLLAYLNSEAELAAVLGHEIAHVTARHAARQHGTQTLTGMLGVLAAAASGIGGAETLTGALGQVIVRGYGRGMELEADEYGARYLAEAGYAPEAMIRVLRTLKNQEQFEIERAEAEDREPRVYHGVFSTHPDNDTRLREGIESAAAVTPVEHPVENRYIFLHLLDGLSFGDTVLVKPGEGGRVSHSELGVSVRFPVGWKVAATRDGFIAHSLRNDGYLQLTGEMLRGTVNPRRYLQSRARGAKLVKPAEFAADNLPGYTAVATQASSNYGTRPVRYGVVADGGRVYIFAGAVEDIRDPYRYDKDFLAAIHSLRPLDDDAKDAAAALKVRLIRAESGMTIEDLAAQSRLKEYAAQQIRLINSLYPDGEPEAGDYIKTIN